ncbi:MAG: hypothetical protein GXP24_10480 [Planctomycetes bacterium]|nr:hypothetical protein [Planctomycetota bacterium]
MESTLLLALALKMAVASSMGVMFGWQPMPDDASNGGTPKIEYIVQIEPELAATLQAGHSIPITSDIPDDIGPIGRIRIVVGREELPRQKLVTHFKPWPVKLSLEGQSREGQSREGIVETQLNVPPVQRSGSGRYGPQAASNNAIFPPGSNVPNSGAANTANPLGRTLQHGAQQAKNFAAEVKQPILPPTGNQLFGNGGFSGQGVQNAIGNTANQLQKGLQQGLERGVQQVADRAGQGLRQAVGDVGQGARDAANNFGRSLLPPSSPPQDGHAQANQTRAGQTRTGHDQAGHNHANGQSQSPATILPLNSPTAGQANNGFPSAKGRRIDQPIQPIQPRRQQAALGAPPANFAGSSPTGTNPNSRSDQLDASWSSTTNIPPASRYANQTNQAPASKSQWPSETHGGRDAFDLANRPPDNRQPQNTLGVGMDGPQLLPLQTQPASQQNASTRWLTNQPATPEIRKEMLDQPASSGMQTASNEQDNQRQTVARQSYGNSPIDTQPRDYSQRQDSNNDLLGNAPKSDPVFPLLLSWVLLTGSGAGNALLWWSYLDVRNKYRGVVQGTPSRRDRYDD